MAYTTDDYRNAPSGIGPLAAEWKDKPHRLVYDLCNRCDRLEGIVCPPKVKAYIDARREEEQQAAEGNHREALIAAVAGGKLWDTLTTQERRQVNQFI